MQKATVSIFLVGFFMLAITPAFAMPEEDATLVLSKSDESIAGRRFLAASEEVLNYISTLRRPSTLLAHLAYRCVLKSRAITVPTESTGTVGGPALVSIRMVYELKNCTEAAN